MADNAGEESAGQDTSNRIDNGVYFGGVIQGRNVSLQLPAPVTSAMYGLPPPSPTFTGRDTHVEELLQGLAPGPRRQEAVLVASVAGLAGVGKTELVVQTATQALKKPGWFPGGALFVDMFGYDDSERRLSPAQAAPASSAQRHEQAQPAVQPAAATATGAVSPFAQSGPRNMIKRIQDT
ncbi:hypothetical protein ACF09Y_33695 [Streptomyces massasporeus]|uniref:hypothetical protein n=1 Tax=Streptomyces massasporeus TaxID=67324 RepID=UPI0036FAF218